jgi:hypothetical protein
MTIKSLLVKISADVTELQGNLRKADGYVKTHAQEIGKIGKTMMVVGAAVSGAIGLMIGKYANAGDALLEMSQRTGMSTETLSELKYVASLCGTNIDGIEKAAKKMAVSIVEAAAGSDQAKDALGRLGLSAQELIGLSPDRQFEKISTALAAIENPTIRADTAVKLFGRSGTDLLPIMAGGVSGLNKMKKEAHDLGQVLSEEDCRKADEFKDTLDKLKGSITGVGNNVARMLVPNLTGLVDKIAGVITKVKDWTSAHPNLSSGLIKVGAGLGVLTTAVGGTLIVLGKLAGSMKTLGVVTNLQLGPIAIVTAALAGLAVGYLAVKDAQDKANAAGSELTKQENKLVEDLSKAAVAAGWHYGEMSKLIEAYHGNIAALTMAIVKGKEGVEIQKALAAIGKEQKAVIDAERQALLDKANAEIKAAMASEAAKKQAEAIMTTRRQLTDEIAKATMKERDYERFALEQAYTARKASITSEITDEKEKAALLLQAEQTYQASRAALEKSFRDQDLAARIAFAQLIADQEDQQTVARIEALKAFAVEKQSITDAINQMTMGELQYKLWAIDQERLAEEQRIKESKEWTIAQQEELLKALDVFYKKKKQKAEQDATGWTELVENTKGAITNILGTLFSSTLDAFRKWGEGGASILGALGEAFKSTVNTALSALRDLVTGMLLASVKEVLMAKAVAIANVIKSVMQSIPFPLNLALVGVAIAGVSALFSKIHLAEGGIVTRPTYAMIGERGPEAVIPLDRPGALAFAGAGVSLRQQNYFYGNISNAGDLDEISKRLAERTTQTISKGRRY